MLADPPPFRETVRPGGVWLPVADRLAAGVGRAPAPPGRPAEVAPRLGVVVRPAVLGRLGVVEWLVALLGRFGVVEWLVAVFGRLGVVV
jgi:hypothetical protein